MAKPVKQREQNSLEAFLLKLKKNYNENKQSFLSYILLFLVVIAAVLFFRVYNGRKLVSQARLDDAYYQASASDLFGMSTTVDLSGYQDLANHYKKGDIAAQAHLAIGDAKVRQAQAYVAQKKSNSKAEYNDEAVAALDPAAAFNEAIAELEAVANPSMDASPAFAARALFAAAAAREGLAMLAADDAAVESALTAAKDGYKKVVSHYAETPYAAQAEERVAALESEQTVSFVKQLADQYRNLPVPPAKPADESILSEGASDKLDPADDASFEQLKDIPTTDETTGDAAPAPETEAE